MSHKIVNIDSQNEKILVRITEERKKVFFSIFLALEERDHCSDGSQRHESVYKTFQRNDDFF